jgi:hypothetical protein
MRVRASDYAIDDSLLKSWVVESSLDGSNWTEIDQQTDDECRGEVREVRSFRVWDENDYPFISLTQTGKNSENTDVLVLRMVEFFRTLSLPCTLAERLALPAIDLHRRGSNLRAEFHDDLRNHQSSLR